MKTIQVKDAYNKKKKYGIIFAKNMSVWSIKKIDELYEITFIRIGHIPTEFKSALYQPYEYIYIK